MQPRLGEVLQARGSIRPEQLRDALTAQRQFGSPLGETLVSQGSLSYHKLYLAVAEHHRLPFINLLEEPPSFKLLHQNDAGMYLRQRMIPWRQDGDTIWIAMCDPSEENLQRARHYWGEHIKPVITSPVDIRRIVELYFSRELETHSRLALWQRAPHASARITLPPHQKRLGFLLLMIGAIIVVDAPVYAALSILIFCHVAYAITMGFKAWVFQRSVDLPIDQSWRKGVEAMDERTLPIYTILIPMYREAGSLPGMIEAMQKLDYPPCKLDIKLVLESDDTETYHAACALKPRYQFEIIRVPPSHPRTKPKACNYALRFARGEYLTVFDADDRPDPLQLKKAIYMFRTAPADVVCLQARLNYYNANDNLLTRFFSLEYAMLFQFMLRGLEKLDIPIPLGGTSNHISLERLSELGEWDPYNVTEDADLGTRLAAFGMKTAMLDSCTMEEAPNKVRAWIRQRSRWIKGYMQTWLVHMRHPVDLYRTLGWKSFLGFQFFVGFSSFTFLTAPLVWILSLLWITSLAEWHRIEFPVWLVWLTVGNLAANILIHWYMALHTVWIHPHRSWALIGAALLFPLYLVLHSLASYKAIWQLIVKPHFWEKTTHGLARTTAFQNMEDFSLPPVPVLAIK